MSETVEVAIDEAGEVTVGKTKYAGTRLAARKKLSLKVAAALLKGSPEAEAAAARCLRYGPALFINGKKEPRVFELPPPVNDLAIKADPATARITRVEVELLGVQLATRWLHLPGVELSAVVSSPRFLRNASGDDIVENDPLWVEAVKRLEERSLELLEQQAADPDASQRAHLIWRLLNDAKLTDDARRIIAAAPLIPCAEGGFLTLAALEADVAKGAPVRFATRTYPQGTCPPNTVLLTGDERAALAQLLPGKRREDVAPFVRRKLRAAENLAQWKAQPEEPAVLAARPYLALVDLDTPKLKGQVGIEASGQGAFVRLLGAGKFLQQGEVNLLAPLRLRAVVDHRGSFSEKTWAEMPNPRLWSAIARRVEEAAEQAICQALREKGTDAWPHARDVLRRAGQQGRDYPTLPKEILDAPLFECLGGGVVSLAELRREATWRYTSRPFEHGLLNEKRVLLLSHDDFELLQTLQGKSQWKDVTTDLEREALVRKRLEGPKAEPVVAGKLVCVSFDSDGVRGEVALAADDTQLNLDLYRDGVLLEHARASAQYGTGWAAADCPELRPNATYTATLRDAAHDKVLAVVRAHERKLAPEVLKRWPRFSKMHASARRYLLAFVQKEIRGADFAALDAYAKPVVETAFIDTPWGATSLLELKQAAANTGHLWLLPPGVDAGPLEGQAVVVGGSEVTELVRAAIVWDLEDGREELGRAAARERFRAQPPFASRVSADAVLRVEVNHRDLKCVAALDSALSPSTIVDVLLEDRLYFTLEVGTALPMRVVAELGSGVDPATPVDDALRDAVREAVAVVQGRMLKRALDAPHAEGARRAVLLALKSRLDEAAGGDLAARLRDTPVFECLDGVSRSTAVFDALPKVCFATRRFEGPVGGQSPVVLCLDDPTAVGLARFKRREDVTTTLELEQNTRAFRSRLPQVSEVALSSGKLVSRRVRGPSIEGEVAVAPDADGTVELLLDQRPLCRVAGALPWPFAAAVNCDTLKPDTSHNGVLRDGTYDNLLRQLLDLCEGLADELSAQWARVGTQPRAREAALRACVWLQARQKKNKRPNPLAELPLLSTTDGQPLTVRALLDEQGRRKEVFFAAREGALLEPNRFVWQATEQQRNDVGPLKLKLTDATHLLAQADAVRARPKVESLSVATASRFREAVVGDGIEGEVALHDRPGYGLNVELLRERTLLETYASEHAVGAVARVNCDGLQPNAVWSKAQRTPQFRAVMEAVERAVERAVTARLLSEPRDDDWHTWCLAAAKWETPGEGPLQHALPALEPFTALDGRSVSIGAAMTEFSRARRVAVAEPGLEGAAGFVLRSSHETLSLLEALHLTVKDVSGELRRKGELEADRLARRLQELAYAGDSLVRHRVEENGLRGELVVPRAGGAGKTGDAEILLAKQGVRVAPLPKNLAPGIAGVLDVDALVVDEAWTTPVLSSALKEQISHHVEALLSRLARAAAELPLRERPAARELTLTWLKHFGVEAPAHFERLQGAALELARAGVFETVDGEWVSAVALGDEVRRRGRVAVFKRSFFTPDTLGALALKAESLTAPWVDALEELLGKSSLERVADPSAWRHALREEDPPKGSDELRGLERLRRDVRLLRSGALGELSPEDLEDVRLTALGGRGAPVQYDVKRKVALLDADHPHVKRALKESATRRERLYVLLAAMYGAINRALKRITDQHEEQLAGALAAHLSANPQLLTPKEEARKGEGPPNRSDGPSETT